MTIEEIVINYLIAQDIDGVGLNVYAEKPVDPPERYITVRRTGGASENRIRNNTLVTEVVSRKSLLDAAEIHEQVLSLMEEARDHTDLYSCTLNSDYNATRPDSKEYAYQALWIAHKM